MAFRVEDSVSMVNEPPLPTEYSTRILVRGMKHASHCKIQREHLGLSISVWRMAPTKRLLALNKPNPKNLSINPAP